MLSRYRLSHGCASLFTLEQSKAVFDDGGGMIISLVEWDFVRRSTFWNKLSLCRVVAKEKHGF